MSITKVSHNSGNSAAITSHKQADIQSDIKDKNELAMPSKHQLNEDKLSSITAELNKCMKSMNTGIGFSLHKETDTLMVQIKDMKTQEVLKEYPAHEFLDQVARIRECVGVFLDKLA